MPSEHDLESKIEGDFVLYVKSRATGAAIKMYIRHWPDRLILKNGGKVFFIEFKRPGEEPRTGQKIIAQLINRMGFEYYVCTSSEEAIRLYEKA